MSVQLGKQNPKRGTRPIVPLSSAHSSSSEAGPVASFHNAWCQHYDWVFERTYGERLTRLTRETLALIHQIAPPPCDILDCGAGTGRLAIPLAMKRYQITALDASEGMLAQIHEKACRRHVTLTLRQAQLHDWRPDRTFDLILCVFIVINYLLDRKTLDSAIGNMASGLRTGGYILLDAAGFELFSEPLEVNEDGFFRTGQFTPDPSAPGCYLYRERCRIDRADGNYCHDVACGLRYWDRPTIEGAFRDADMTLAADFSKEFVYSGSTYFLFQKGGGQPSEALPTSSG